MGCLNDLQMRPHPLRPHPPLVSAALAPRIRTVPLGSEVIVSRPTENRVSLNRYPFLTLDPMVKTTASPGDPS